MATPNRCCGQSPKRYHNAHTGKFWLECAACGRWKMARSHALVVEWWNLSTERLHGENIPAYINQESAIFRGTHHA